GGFVVAHEHAVVTLVLEDVAVGTFFAVELGHLCSGHREFAVLARRVFVHEHAGVTELDEVRPEAALLLTGELLTTPWAITDARDVEAHDADLVAQTLVTEQVVLLVGFEAFLGDRALGAHAADTELGETLAAAPAARGRAGGGSRVAAPAAGGRRTCRGVTGGRLRAAAAAAAVVVRRRGVAAAGRDQGYERRDRGQI